MIPGVSNKLLLWALVLSVVSFVGWPVPLWEETPGASHVGRLAGSYLFPAFILFVALMLNRGFSIARWISALAIIFLAKFIITIVLYHFLAPGSAHDLSPPEIDLTKIIKK